MIKNRIAVMAVALSFVGATACFAAAPAASPAPAKPANTTAPKKEAAKTTAPMNAHMGTWKANAAKSNFAPGMGKTSTVMYAQNKDQLQVTVDGVGADGKPTHGVWMGKADGKVYKVKGNLAWDAMTYKMVDANTYDMTGLKGGKPSWSGRSTVAKDGKSRTLNMSGTAPDGKKFKAKVVYDKA